MEIYLDNAATTRPYPEVIRAVTEALAETYGNPSSLHRKGLEAELLVNAQRKTLARALGCEPSEIIFTSGATESNNLALRGAAAIYGKRKPHIVVSSVEHDSVRNTLNELEAQGYRVTRVAPEANGKFLPEKFLQAASEETSLVSVMAVENETGNRLPVKEIFQCLRRRFPKIVCHCDFVQGFLKEPLTAEQLGADMISVSAHKIHGPKGIGALFLRKGTRLQPLFAGGAQENALRPGTESVPLIAGFGEAVRQQMDRLEENARQVRRCRENLESRLSVMEGTALNRSPDSSDYILNFSVRGIRSETMLHFLEERDIFVSSGSACAKGARSHVLTAYGFSPDRADSALRVSFSAENTEEDVAALAEAISQGQKKLAHK